MGRKSFPNQRRSDADIALDAEKRACKSAGIGWGYDSEIVTVVHEDRRVTRVNDKNMLEVVRRSWANSGRQAIESWPWFLKFRGRPDLDLRGVVGLVFDGYGAVSVCDQAVHLDPDDYRGIEVASFWLLRWRRPTNIETMTMLTHVGTRRGVERVEVGDT